MKIVTNEKFEFSTPFGWTLTLYERESADWFNAALLDAERYRKLRSIALHENALEAFVAMNQLDFVSDQNKFDNIVDSTE